MRFDSHYLMTKDDVIDYVFEHTDFFSSNENLICEEIGDGNINYVYRITDTVANKSLILKQADVQTRVRPDGYLSTDRNAREAEVLQTEYHFTPDLVPKVFYADKTMAVIIMEDIGSFCNLKKELMQGKIFLGLGTLLAGFIINTTFPMTELILGNKKKLEAAFKFRNPELCKITEDLVFTYPYYDIRKRNIVLPENKKWLENNLHKKNIIARAAQLKQKFNNFQQSLIHGDLHSGSIFVKLQNNNLNIKIIDPEFAFYGPIAYDLGNVLAHLIFAEVYIKYTDNNLDPLQKIDFLKWINLEKKYLFNVFTKEGIKFIKGNVCNSFYYNNIFIKQYIDEIKLDAVSFAGMELNRRVIGSAKTAEISTVKDIDIRIMIERELVKRGINMMVNPDSFFKRG